MSSRTFMLAVIATAIGVAACGSYGTSVVEIKQAPPRVASISLTVPVSLTTGQTARAVATPKDVNGAALAGRAVAWFTSSAAVASVTDSGLVLAVAPGTAVVSAVSEGVSGQASLLVSAPPAVAVASVSVSPATSTLQIGSTVQLSAVTRDANNNVLTGRVITWGSGNTGIATVSASGLVTAVATGSASITASSEGQTGSAAISVSAASPPPPPPPAPVASVSVSPATSSLQVGSTVQFSAVTRDASNNVLTGRVISWSSSDNAVATVSTSGLVTAVAAGSAQVTATSEGQIGSASLTVTSPPPPPPPPPPGSSNEPPGMTVITDRPFNALNESGWSDIFDPNMAFIQDPSAPHSAPGILRATFPAGNAYDGSGPGASDFATGNKRTLYMARWIKYSANWYGHPSGVNKMAYVHTSSGDVPVLVFSAIGAGSAPLSPYVDLQFTVTPGGGSNLAPNLVPNAEIIRGQWNLLELVAVGNTAGNADGSVDWYLNGVHVGSYAVQWQAGATTWGRVHYTTIWGGYNGGAASIPATQWRDDDHLYLSEK